jgi:hypothetical protein
MVVIKGASFHTKLLSMFIANLAIFVFAIHAVTWRLPTSEEIEALMPKVGSLSISVIVVGLINAQLGPKTKARLVFWRWHYPLPGHRAFSLFAHCDPRIDVDCLFSIVGHTPEGPAEENAAWFRLYRNLKDDAVIHSIHAAYLFFRDYCGMSFLLLLAFSPLALWLGSDKGIACTYVGALAVQFLVTRRAAKERGERLVTTVLAYTAMNSGGENG